MARQVVAQLWCHNGMTSKDHMEHHMPWIWRKGNLLKISLINWVYVNLAFHTFTNRTVIYHYRAYVIMLSGKRIQLACDSADYIHCPNVGPTYDSERIQTAYECATYIYWPNVDPTDDSQRIPYILSSFDSVDNKRWSYVGPMYKTNPNQKPTARSTAYVGPTSYHIEFLDAIGCCISETRSEECWRVGWPYSRVAPLICYDPSSMK